jgi:WXG100 family type VII secretion target
MPGGRRIQANYDDLGAAANLFARESQQTQQLMQQVGQLVGSLQGGGWIGLGANAFFQEMEELVNPAMQRLVNALNDASSAAKRIADVFKQAEEEAGSLFR